MFTGSLPLFILTRIRDILAPEKDLKAKFTFKRKINARLKKKKVHLFMYWSLQKNITPAAPADSSLVIPPYRHSFSAAGSVNEL